MSSQLIKNAKDPEDLDELLDFGQSQVKCYNSKDQFLVLPNAFSSFSGIASSQ